MNDFVAAVLVIMALVAVGNFASDHGAMSKDCVGSQSWVRVCSRCLKEYESDKQQKHRAPDARGGVNERSFHCSKSV